MAIPVLLIDQNGNESTKTYEKIDLIDILSCAQGNCQEQVALPPDEGLNKENCYRIYIKVAE